MKKIVILKGHEGTDNYDDYYFRIENNYWDEVEDDEYEFIKENLYRLNVYPTAYRVLTYVEANEVRDILEQLKEIKAKDEVLAAKKRVTRLVAKEKAAATEVERKRKQLEKLKKELGES